MSVSIIIDGETGPIGWCGIQTVNTLLDEEVQVDRFPIKMNYDKEVTFDCGLKLSKSGFKILFLGWRAKGPYRKRLIERLKRARPYYNWTFELRSDEV